MNKRLYIFSFVLTFLINSFCLAQPFLEKDIRELHTTYSEADYYLVNDGGGHFNVFSSVPLPDDFDAFNNYFQQLNTDEQETIAQLIGSAKEFTKIDQSIGRYNVLTSWPLRVMTCCSLFIVSNCFVEGFASFLASILGTCAMESVCNEALIQKKEEFSSQIATIRNKKHAQQPPKRLSQVLSALAIIVEYSHDDIFNHQLYNNGFSYKFLNKYIKKSK